MGLAKLTLTRMTIASDAVAIYSAGGVGLAVCMVADVAMLARPGVRAVPLQLVLCDCVAVGDGVVGSLAAAFADDAGGVSFRWMATDAM